MGKLKNYEIDAIIATIETKFKEKRDARIKELANTIELTDKEKQLLTLSEDIKKYTNLISELDATATSLYKEINPKDMPWAWKYLTKEQMKKNKADSLINMDINLSSIRNELILNNIEGNNVTNFIEEVLNRYNF